MQKINPKYCFQAQLSLEGLKIVNGNKIVKINTDHFDIEKSEKEEPPKVLAVNFGDQINIFYSVLISGSLIFNLEKIEKHVFLDDQQKIIGILKKKDQYEKSGHYITYIFPNNITVDPTNTKIFNDSKNELIKKFDPSFYGKFPKVYAVMHSGEIVACCVSSRENDLAGEAWIFTLPKYRKKGFGSKAVQLWASELQKIEKIPFYTHKKSNIASQKLAEKLGLIKVFEIISYK